MSDPIPGNLIDEVDPAWWIARTQRMVRDWCPGCEPDVDPIEEMVEISRCPQHPVSSTGSADDRVLRAYIHPFTTVIDGGP